MVNDYHDRPTTRANTTGGLDTVHPGDMLFIDLTKKLRAAVSRGWGMEDDQDGTAINSSALADQQPLACRHGRLGRRWFLWRRRPEFRARADDEPVGRSTPSPRGPRLERGPAPGRGARGAHHIIYLPSLDAVVLWIAVTHGLDAFDHATRLAIHSPVKRCGNVACSR